MLSILIAVLDTLCWAKGVSTEKKEETNKGRKKKEGVSERRRMERITKLEEWISRIAMVQETALRSALKTKQQIEEEEIFKNRWWAQ